MKPKSSLPYYMLFGGDVVLLIDNLLKPRGNICEMKTMKSDIFFVQARNKIRKSAKMTNEKLNKNRQEVKFGVRNPVYYKIQARGIRTNKLLL